MPCRFLIAITNSVTSKEYSHVLKILKTPNNKIKINMFSLDQLINLLSALDQAHTAPHKPHKPGPCICSAPIKSQN